MSTKKSKHELRLSRLITLAYLLSSRSEIHIDELIERLGVNRKEIEEDLNVLMFCGLPPYSPEQLFDISIEDDFVSMYFNNVFVSPLRLNESERQQVIVALAKLRSSVESNSEIENIDTISKIIDSSLSENIAIESSNKFIDELSNAIESNCAIEIEYLSLNSASISKRIIYPRSIYSTASTSYVFAYDPELNLKNFRIDRILSASIANDKHFSDLPISKHVDVEMPENINEHMYFNDEDNYVDFKIENPNYWLVDSYPNSNIKDDIYRFSAPSTFFIARILLSNYENISFVQSSYDKNSIVKAINVIHRQMLKTAGVDE